MRSLLFILAIVVLPLTSNLHAFPGSDSQRQMPAMSQAPMAPANPHAGANNATAGAVQGMVGVVQDIVMAGYGKATVGEAFGRYSYLKKKQWNETKGKGGIVYVDFVGLAPRGWFDFTARKQGITSRGIEVKFVIHPNGDYEVGMVSRVEVKDDGKTYRYPIADIGSVLDAIYANKKINL